MSRRAVVCITLVLQWACVAEIHEQCSLITDQVPAPAMPAELARVDSLLVQRAICMSGAAHDLRGSMARSFRIYFAYETLPVLCARLGQARQLASSGRIREAGRKYQALLVATQVIELAISIHAFSEYADGMGAPTGRILEMQAAFGDQMVPLLDAALSEDPSRIQRALADHGAEYGAWLQSLTRWSSQVNAQAPRLKTAKLVWDIGMLVVATYDAAAEAAQIAAAGRPPIPPSPVLVEGAGVAAAGMSPVAYAELAEALRKLVASGALDGAIVAGLSHLTGGAALVPILPVPMQMSGNGGPPEHAPAKGIGGSGWRGDAGWKRAVKLVDQGGTIRSVDGKVPTVDEARALINEAGGRVERFEPPHKPPNPHDFWHINYYTSNGAKGTIEVLP
jgi:hypothetical protein